MTMVGAAQGAGNRIMYISLDTKTGERRSREEEEKQRRIDDFL